MSKQNDATNFTFIISQVVDGEKKTIFQNTFNCYLNEPKKIPINEDGIPNQNAICFKYSWEVENLKRNLIFSIKNYLKYSAKKYMNGVYENTTSESFVLKNGNEDIKYNLKLICNNYPLRSFPEGKTTNSTTSLEMFSINVGANEFPYNENYTPTFYKIWGNYNLKGVEHDGLRTQIKKAIREKYFTNRFFNNNEDVDNLETIYFNV